MLYEFIGRGLLVLVLAVVAFVLVAFLNAWMGTLPEPGDMSRWKGNASIMSWATLGLFIAFLSQVVLYPMVLHPIP